LQEFHLDLVSSSPMDLPDMSFHEAAWQQKDWYVNFHRLTPVIVVNEIHAIISNVSTSSQTIHKDTRVGQLVITPVVIADFVLDLGEERGTGAFGSTGE